jgi:hypothetical protein
MQAVTVSQIHERVRLLPKYKLAVVFDFVSYLADRPRGLQTRQTLVPHQEDTDVNVLASRPRLTAKELLESELIGLWKDREDIEDSVLYARHLRSQAQLRGGGQ